MRNRCANPRNPVYKWYGARGITVCKQWNDFAVFDRWSIANGYKPGLTIDRIDNMRGYSPENCRWADYKTQAQNTRQTKTITYNGLTFSLSEWSRRLGLGPRTIHARIQYGYSPIEAVTLKRYQMRKQIKN